MIGAASLLLRISAIAHKSPPPNHKSAPLASLLSSSVKAEPTAAAAGMREFSTRAGQPLFDINDKFATITPRGDQYETEGQLTTVSQSGNGEWDGVLPAIQEEHERRVGTYRSIISGNKQAPVRLREDCQEGRGLVHYLEGYSNPEYIEAQNIADSFGVEVIPVTDTSGTINAFIYDVGSALIRDPITLEIKKCFGKGRSPFIPRREPLARSQAEARRKK